MENYDKKVLDLALEAGRILLEAGAEIFRVEETIRRIAKSYGITKCDAFVLSTGIFLTAENEEGEMYASVKHIPLSGARLHRIAAVNQLSREIEEKKYPLEQAQEQLEIIKSMPEKRGIVKMLASGLGSACFCHLLGGGLQDMTAAFLTGFILYAVILAMEKRKKKTSKIVVNIIGGFCVSFFAVFFYKLGLGKTPGTILVGAVMPLVPGVSLLNAVRDFADGDYIGGGVRFLDVLVIALGISMGVGIMYVLYYQLTGGIIL